MTRASGALGQYLYRCFGACVLDAGTYESLESDPAVTGQAATTVVAASLAAGFAISGLRGPSLGWMLAGTVLSLVVWVTWAMLMFQLGGRLFPASATKISLGELLRTTGFAAAPGVLQVFAVIPGATALVFGGTGIWMFVAMVVAVKHALDYESVGRAVLVCAAALVLCALVTAIVAALLVTVVS